MAIIKYDTGRNKWYRTARLFVKTPPGQTNHWQYDTLDEAIRQNPGVPVEQNGTLSSVKNITGVPVSSADIEVELAQMATEIPDTDWTLDDQ